MTVTVVCPEEELVAFFTERNDSIPGRQLLKRFLCQFYVVALIRRVASLNYWRAVENVILNVGDSNLYSSIKDHLHTKMGRQIFIEHHWSGRSGNGV
jgi:hypothetical protein